MNMFTLLLCLMLAKVTAACENSQCTEKRSNGAFTYDSDCCALGLDRAGCLDEVNFVATLENNNGCFWNDNKGTCCKQRTGQCSKDWCTSPGVIGHDCWAGSFAENCTCKQGNVVMTGETDMFDGVKYYEYTCCLGGTHEENCGDHPNWGAIIVIILVCGTLGCICCGLTIYCFTQKNRQRRPGVVLPNQTPMVSVGNPTIGQMGQPQQPYMVNSMSIPQNPTVYQPQGQPYMVNSMGAPPQGQFAQGQFNQGQMPLVQGTVVQPIHKY